MAGNMQNLGSPTANNTTQPPLGQNMAPPTPPIATNGTKPFSTEQKTEGQNLVASIPNQINVINPSTGQQSTTPQPTQQTPTAVMSPTGFVNPNQFQFFPNPQLLQQQQRLVQMRNQQLMQNAQTTLNKGDPTRQNESIAISPKATGSETAQLQTQTIQTAHAQQQLQQMQQQMAN